MSFRIQSPPQNAHAAPADLEPGKPEDTKAKDDTAKVGREFEAIFVRQMLTSTKVAGKSGGYADMAVEALASSITAAGGLGMGRAIEQALSSHTVAQHPIVPLADPKNEPSLPQVPSGPAVRRGGP